MRTAGFVLVGGLSTRMGRDKARLPFASGLLVESIAKKVKQAAGSVCLVGGGARYRDLAIDSIDDLRPRCGPLAGIEAALDTKRAEFNLIVACDMPDLSSSWLEQLLAEAQDRGSKCLISRDPAGVLHPLCGVWRSDSIGSVTEALNESRLRLLELVRDVDADVLTCQQPLANVNTPDEWNCWQLTR